ncbi:PilW family protein [Pseudomonas sp. SA3-5]|uniref:PilW family protein n=1 Tax=Pseudomonas aestuarii TaxID=3018340 RepID=A0ABT4X9R6_9PSED|nr:PilW family protein [Pseudomonas aestuarii]MDA7085119.1 PilW family protein [Pseudomonas aestuarii]
MKTQSQKLPIARRVPKAARGFSLIELMVAMIISLLIMGAILTLFLDVTRTNDEMAKTNVLIENGRFSLQLMQSDVQHAGFWGELDNNIDPPTAIPDPCAVAGWNAAYKTNLIGIPVQSFPDATGLAGCGVTGVLANSDVLMVRHANTCVKGATGCDGGSDTGWHIQVSGCRNVGTEDPYVIDKTTFPLRTKTCSLTPPIDLAPQRKVVSKLYYLANSGGVPTLMRVELVNGAYADPQPLIEGVESFRVELGLDTKGKNGLPISASNPGDGSADEFKRCTALTPCVLDDLANVVAVKLYVLVRNTVATRGYTDTKAYQLGSIAVAAANDGFKRHVFSTTVRLVNPSSRREIP